MRKVTTTSDLTKCYTELNDKRFTLWYDNGIILFKVSPTNSPTLPRYIYDEIFRISDDVATSNIFILIAKIKQVQVFNNLIGKALFLNEKENTIFNIS